MDFSKTSMDAVLADAIPAHQTVAGWWFFDSKVKCHLEQNQKVRYRVSLTTFSGIKYEHTTPELLISDTPNPPGNTKGKTTPILFYPLGKFDISTYPRRLYSAPIPSGD